MAIYHYSSGVITRSKKGAAAKSSGARGSSAGDQRVAVSSVVAAAAYRAGEDLALTWDKNPFTRLLLAADPEKVFPEKGGDKSIEIMTQSETQFNYSRKKGVAHTEIFAPEGAPSWVYDRESLWNKVENSEKRVDSVLARHIDAALPVELDLDACKKLVGEFVKQNFTDKGMIADVAFHDMGSHNPHIHILLTTRELEGDGFADKKCAAWQATYAAGNGRVLVAGGGLDVQRETWAAVCNKALEDAGREERITHQSHKALGIERKPTFHIGKDAWYAELRGIRTEIMSRLKDILVHNVVVEKLRKLKNNLQMKPLYKLPALDNAREAFKQAFDQAPNLSLFPRPPDKDR